MATRLLSFAIWAVVAATAVFWLTRLLARADPPPAHAVTVSTSASVASADLSRLFGSTRVAAEPPAAEPAADTRYKLIGVVAPKSAAAAALALIAVDNKPPRPVSLGGVVDGSLVLLAVNHRRAELGPAGGAATVRLELPAVPEPNRSVRAFTASPPPPVAAAPPMPAAAVPIPPPTGAAASIPRPSMTR
ncbi:MAG TPA: type II secretion system protein N [Burkholderiaceae bacterium]|nr:type II secretion system protein N [Burkholderiaceae bacterium]